MTKVQHASFPAVKLTRQFTFVIIGCFDDTMDPVPVCAVCMKHFESATEDHRPHSLPCGHSLCCKCLDMIDNHRQQQQQQLQEAVLRSKISPEDLQLTHDVIGWGAAGVVRRGVLSFRGSQLKVAVKLLSAHNATPAEISSAEQEINNKAYAAQACSQVVRVFAHCTKDQQICLVMLPHADSLVTLVEGGMSEQRKLQSAWQLAKAVQQLHDRHMLNLNIKPNTVLFDDFGDVVLSGPGTLQQMRAGSQFMSSSYGTDNLTSADVWSLACTILYIFTQTLHFENMNSTQIGAALQAGHIPTIPDSLPLDLQRMLRQCFTWPDTRSTAAVMALKLQAMIEATSVWQAGDMASGMPFLANASSRQPNLVLTTGSAAAAAGQQVAALAKLVLQLHFKGHSSQTQAARMIEEQALDCPQDRTAIIAAGALPPLVAMLRSDQPGVQEQAANTLYRLAEGLRPWHIKDAIIAADAVPLILTLLMANQLAVQEAAAAALSVLTSGSQESCDAIIAAGAVPLLVTLSRSDSWSVQDIAAGTLANLAWGSQHNQDAIIAADALPVLLTMLSSHRSEMQEIAACALCNLASGSQKNSDAITAAGALPLLARRLRSNDRNVQAQAAGALAKLAVCSQKARHDIIAAGAVPPLVALLRSDEPGVQAEAAQTLKIFAHESQQNQDAICAAGAVPLLLALCRSELPELLDPVVYNIAIAALDSLVPSSLFSS